MALTLLLVAAIGGQLQSAPLRIGPLAQQLTEAQLAELAQLAVTSDDARVWLVIGSEAFTPPPRAWTVDIYMTADIVTPQVRRGRIATAVSTGAAADSARLRWALRGVARWG